MHKILCCILLLTACTPLSRGQKSGIYLPSETDLIWKCGIKKINIWRTHHKTGKRELQGEVVTDGSKKYVKEISYFDFKDNRVTRIKEETWNAETGVFTYSDTETDSTGETHLILKRYDYYTPTGFMYKRVAESMPDRFWHFTNYIDEKNPGFQNNVLYKINLPSDTHQIITNKQNASVHEYTVKEKQNGNWIITEQSFTRYKNGVYYGYENYRNGRLLNKFTPDTLIRASDTLVNLDHDFMEYGLPPHEHPTPSDTTWSTDGTFKTKKLVVKKKTGENQFKRVRLFMDESHEDQIEEWIFDPRGLLIKLDVMYDDYVLEYEYK